MNCSYVLSGCQICGCFSYQYFMKVNIENMNTLHTRKLGLIPQSFMGGVLPNDFFFCSSFIIYHLLLRSDLLFQVKKIRCVSVVTHLKFFTGCCYCQSSHGRTVFPSDIIYPRPWKREQNHVSQHNNKAT